MNWKLEVAKRNFTGQHLFKNQFKYVIFKLVDKIDLPYLNIDFDFSLHTQNGKKK